MTISTEPGGASATAPNDVRRPALLVFGLLFVVFAATAQWGLPYHIDAVTNAVTGWHLGNERTVILDRYSEFTDEESHGVVGWYTGSPKGTVSQYPPGAALWTGLFYAVTPGELEDKDLYFSNDPSGQPTTIAVPPLWPATLSAVVATAGACALLTAVFIRLGATKRVSVVAGVIAGVATAAWSVASNASWMHGPGMLLVAGALYFAQRERWAVCGLFFAGSILVRPHLALIAASIGVGLLLRRSTRRGFWMIGATSALGLFALLGFNLWLFETLTISGGYGSSFESRLTSASPGWFVQNVAGGLFDLGHGLLPWAPFLLVLGVAAVKVRGAPPWATWSALGGAAYLLVQWRANRFSGGDGHDGYRYPLEAMTAAAPLLFLGYEQWVRGVPTRERLLRVGLAIAIALQAIASLR